MTPWTVACQAPLSMRFYWQEYWSGLPFPTLGNLSHTRIKPRSPALQADSLLSESPGKPCIVLNARETGGNKTDMVPGFMKLKFCLFNKVDWWISKRHYSELQCFSGFFCVLSHSVVSDSLKPHGLQLTRLFCPWDSPGKNSGVACHALVQGIFLTQG